VPQVGEGAESWPSPARTALPPFLPSSLAVTGWGDGGNPHSSLGQTGEGLTRSHPHPVTNIK